MKDATYDRPVRAKLLVQLENGETFDATDEDLVRFGFVDPSRVTRKMNEWLRSVHPEINDLTDSPLNVFRYAAECAAHYPDMPSEEYVAEARSIVAAALNLHLITRHAVSGFVEDPFDLHQHEHDGPGTIRNHDRGDVDYDEDRVAEILGADQ